MPYIKQLDRDKFNNVEIPYINGPGELNYFITIICQSYLMNCGLNYAHINEVVGALECAKLELYRRIASPYEDKKILENGDVNCLTTS